MRLCVDWEIQWLLQIAGVRWAESQQTFRRICLARVGWRHQLGLFPLEWVGWGRVHLGHLIWIQVGIAEI